MKIYRMKQTYPYIYVNPETGEKEYIEDRYNIFDLRIMFDTSMLGYRIINLSSGTILAKRFISEHGAKQWLKGTGWKLLKEFEVE